MRDSSKEICNFFNTRTNSTVGVCLGMQVANYPSQLHAPSSADLRKKAHVDSGTLTLLASQDWLTGSNWSVGDGGLQLLSAQGDWREVQVPQGEPSSSTERQHLRAAGSHLLPVIQCSR